MNENRKTKVTILTPVHVGNGVNVEPVCYLCKNGVASRYAIEDLLSSLPAEKLLDPANLNRLARGSDSKRDFYSIFNTRSVPEAKPLYCLDWYEPETLQAYLSKSKGNRKAGSLEVAEQVKALNLPIIPGSTLKGAIECAFKYTLLKKNYGKVSKNLLTFCQSVKKTTPSLFYLQLIYGLDQKQASKYDDFVRDLYGCLLVQDLSFRSMELLAVDRYYYDPAKTEYSCGLSEHISSGEVALTEFPFRIDEFRKELLVKKYPMDAIQRELIESFCSKEKLIEAIRTYSTDMIENDDLPPDLDLSGLGKVRMLAEQQNTKKNSFVMRLGQNTTYFFKTVSRLFYLNDRELFEEYFGQVFSPASMKGKNAPDPTDFPRTFSFAVTPTDLWATGFVLFEYAHTN
ncbi:RAMP superfamily CRISPR-associated protein [Allobaculum sp. JKK-2023]|uniref:RAMP superfamily CRISPR-associated protein n=1 Tax=Allobaculum sp. JKK-2023 TaxID=3108943 RepID=UPI002B05DCEA|nr:RAMP superfamily CRISPR-associated protein [Allobaculum sp. JKK-2023]